MNISPGTSSSRRIWMGYLAAVGASVSYCASQTVAKHITDHYAPPLIATAFALLFGFLYVSVIFHRRIYIELRTCRQRGIIWFTLSGITSASGAMFLYFSLSNASVVIVSPIVSISPLIALVLAHFLLRRLENVTRRTLGGTLMVVLGVLLVVVSS